MIRASKSQKDFLRKIGKKGGQTTKKKHGPDHYRKIGAAGRKKKLENARKQKAKKATSDEK